MLIKTEDRNTQIYLSVININNEICISMTDDYGDVITYLNIDQTKNIIKFLSEQVDTFNNKTK